MIKKKRLKWLGQYWIKGKQYVVGRYAGGRECRWG